MPAHPTCTAPACTRPPYSKKADLCGTHYQRQRRGQPLDEPVRARDLARVPGLRITRVAYAALEGEAEERGETVYATAQRWIEERAAGVRER